MDKNCITYWLPKIQGHVPTPKTEIVKMTLTPHQDKGLWGVLDGDGPPEWFDEWLGYLKSAALIVSEKGPWFLRTGVFSGKHDWSRCCAVTGLSDIGDHVLSLFEMSQIVDMRGLPYNVWAIREWLHGPCLLKYGRFAGMPIRREFRAFAKEGEVLCIHPYWPPEALDESVTDLPGFQEMNELGNDEEAVNNLVKAASEQVEGAWSIDCLWTDNGWYVTDMAEAHRSYHWPDCEHDAKRIT